MSPAPFVYGAAEEMQCAGPAALSPEAGPAAAPAPAYAALGSFAQPGFAAIPSGSFLLTQNNTMPPVPPSGQTESLVSQIPFAAF